jgi:hypothetical protein
LLFHAVADFLPDLQKKPQTQAKLNVPFSTVRINPPASEAGRLNLLPETEQFRDFKSRLSLTAASLVYEGER